MWPPIIYLSGATATGKGTLGKKLAANFGLYHVSMGDLRRRYLEKLRAGAPGIDHDIQQYIVEGKEIPQELLKRYNTIPAIIQYHNHRAQGLHSWTSQIASAMLEEELAELRAPGQQVGRYKAILIDGHPLTGGVVSQIFVEKYLPIYSGLTIAIDCPREVCKRRYVERARVLSENEAKFETRMALTDKALPVFLELMASYGEIVHSTNDDTMTIDDAYNALVGQLRESRVFFSLTQGQSRA
ncbi:P-loop containing nucleoside triphosphate hydrolase protein [Xylaria intraflava]|nr:P-loop containing nucleoside triphosphate hydrolase protein [Xylaria intraflava]